MYRMVHTRYDRHIRFDCHLLGRDFISHRPHDVRCRSDKGNPVSLTGIYKFRIFRQESIPRMDRIHIFLFGNPDDGLDIQIRIDRSFIRIQLI